ncbi:hypothetical protein J1614_001412 [Plenodomus biglobosus]|nr:hypothetical protein J1614_001412 [Plenodomus biglobosus]
MSSSSLYYRPSSSCNWADDEDDNFDFDAWKANADTSAPSVSELGPLQPALSEEEYVAFVTEHAPFMTVEAADTDNTPAPAVSSTCNPAIVSEDVQLARDAILYRALGEVPDAPAYPEMSFYHYPDLNRQQRTSYTSNWNHYKANNGFDCRRTVLFRPSPLRQVTHVAEAGPSYYDDIAALETFSEICIEDLSFTDTIDSESSNKENILSLELELALCDESLDTSFTDTIDSWERSASDCGSESSNKENIPLSLELELALCNESLDTSFTDDDINDDEDCGTFRDEGYYSATPPESPTEETFGEKILLAYTDTLLDADPESFLVFDDDNIDDDILPTDTDTSLDTYAKSIFIFRDSAGCHGSAHALIAYADTPLDADPESFLVFDEDEETIDDEILPAFTESPADAHPESFPIFLDSAESHDSVDTLVALQNDLAHSEVVEDVLDKAAFDKNIIDVTSIKYSNTDLGLDYQVLDFSDLATWPLPSAVHTSHNDKDDLDIYNNDHPEGPHSSNTHPLEVATANDEPLEATDLPLRVTSTLPSTTMAKSAILSSGALAATSLRTVYGVLDRTRNLLHRC